MGYSSNPMYIRCLRVIVWGRVRRVESEERVWDVHADLKNLELIPKMWLELDIKWFSPQVLQFYWSKWWCLKYAISLKMSTKVVPQQPLENSYKIQRCSELGRMKVLHVSIHYYKPNSGVTKNFSKVTFYFRYNHQVSLYSRCVRRKRWAHASWSYWLYLKQDPKETMPR